MFPFLVSTFVKKTQLISVIYDQKLMMSILLLNEEHFYISLHLTPKNNSADIVQYTEHSVQLL